MGVPTQRRKVGRTLLVLAVILIVVVLLLLPPTQDLFRKYLLDPFSPHYPEDVEIELRRTLTLDANGGQVTQYSIDLPRPVSIFSDGVYLQHIDDLDVTPHYDQLVEDGTYDTMLWEGEDLYGTITVSITQKVTQTLHRWDLDEGTVLGRDQVPQGLIDSYLDDEWQIIVDDPLIDGLREEIVGDETNVYVIALSIYNWMLDNVEYPDQITSGGPKSSLETYADKEGDCDDQSILFCALARSAGVPAWMQLGAIYDRSSGEMGGHGWVQMYMPTADGGMNVTIDIVNKDFLVWMPNLFCEYTDSGQAGDLYNAYHHIQYSIPISTPSNEMPIYSDTMEVLSYHESEEKVTLSLELSIKEEF
ncbi:MAG: transglutaminase-like domain-containing protein [Methanomassiliicoccales archaeon]|nr:transglutaminase-like domain-containing protein [Methanomassiliicoccales archaeon]